MAHKKTGGATKNGRDSISKRLGVKIASGQKAYPGNIIVRQRGTKYRNGLNVKRGNDDTLYAVRSGIVSIHKKYRRSHYNNTKKIVTYVEVSPVQEKKTAKAPAK